MLGLQFTATEYCGPAPAIPVPVSGICTWGALLVTTRLPVAWPTSVGSKFTATLTVWFGASVTVAVPPTANTEFPVDTEEMLTVEVPAFVSVTFWVDVMPTLVFPKLSDVALGESWTVVATMFALRPIDVGEPSALLVTATVPEALPGVDESKAIARDALWPAVSVSGSENGDTANPFPVAATCVTVTAMDPTFDKSTVWV